MKFVRVSEILELPVLLEELERSYDSATFDLRSEPTHGYMGAAAFDSICSIFIGWENRRELKFERATLYRLDDVLEPTELQWSLGPATIDYDYSYNI